MKTTVIVETGIRDELKKIGHKGESYNEIIYELIQRYNNPKKERNSQHGG